MIWTRRREQNGASTHDHEHLTAPVFTRFSPNLLGAGGGVWFQDISDTRTFDVSRHRRQLLEGSSYGRRTLLGGGSLKGGAFSGFAREGPRPAPQLGLQTAGSLSRRGRGRT